MEAVLYVQCDMRGPWLNKVKTEDYNLRTHWNENVKKMKISIWGNKKAYMALQKFGKVENKPKKLLELIKKWQKCEMIT